MRFLFVKVFVFFTDVLSGATFLVNNNNNDDGA